MTSTVDSTSIRRDTAHSSTANSAHLAAAVTFSDNTVTVTSVSDTNEVSDTTQLSGEAPVRLHGVDVSNNQGPGIDWDKVRGFGMQFAMIKASQGTEFVDPYFEKNFTAAKRVGLLRGAYHFAAPGQAGTATDEAANFLSVVQPLMKPGDIPVLDMEYIFKAGLGADDIAQDVLDFDEAVFSVLKQHVMLYSNPYFIQTWLSSAALSHLALWLASYIGADDGTQPATGPLLIPPWDIISMWQYTDKGYCPGIGAVDFNLFYGSPDQFAKLGLPNAPAKPAPVPTKYMVFVAGSEGMFLRTVFRQDAPFTQDERGAPIFLRNSVIVTRAQSHFAPSETTHWLYVAISIEGKLYTGYAYKPNLQAQRV